MKYKVEITETLQKIVEVEAETANKAVTQVCQTYANCEIVLDAEDCVGYEIKEYKEGE